MAEEIPQSHIKLATTVTAGAGGEHSPYYRRMLSAGYKGLIQGTIGGATLYGTFGAGIGALVGVGLMFVPGVNLLGFAAIPIMAAAGMYKGADTFGSVGAHAAIYAEGAEMNERRRALLDRLSETNSQKEADEILNLLHQEAKEKPPEKMFHWKAMLVGAALGGIATMLLLTPAAAGALHFIVGPLTEAIMGAGITAAVAPALAATITAGVGIAIGALAGATIGIDRYYIRKWFDASEDLVHDPEKSQSAALGRQQEANRLHAISKTDTSEPQQARIDTRSVAGVNQPQVQRYDDETHRPRVRVDSAGAQRETLMSAEEAMKIPL